MKIKRNILFTPGPATTTDTVKKSLVVSDICPREDEFIGIMKMIRDDLVKIVKGKSQYTSILLCGSGTAAMDACVNSVVPAGKKLAIVNNGAYGERLVKIAKAYGIDYVDIAFEWGEVPNIERIEKILGKDKKIACLAVIHHETSTGVLNPIKAIGKIAKKNNCVYIVDAISSYAGIPIDIKNNNIDFLMSTSNKCIQGMAGIAFVICRKAALDKIKHYPRRSFYLSLYDQFAYFEKTGQMQFTSPVQVIYALKQAIREYFREGGLKRYNRYTANWRILRKGLLKLGFKLLLKKDNESHLLMTICYLDDRNFDFNIMHDLLYKKGFTVYPGNLGSKETFRLGNIGDLHPKDINNFLKALREVLIKIKVRVK